MATLNRVALALDYTRYAEYKRMVKIPRGVRTTERERLAKRVARRHRKATERLIDRVLALYEETCREKGLAMDWRER